MFCLHACLCDAKNHPSHASHASQYPLFSQPKPITCSQLPTGKSKVPAKLSRASKASTTVPFQPCLSYIVVQALSISWAQPTQKPPVSKTLRHTVDTQTHSRHTDTQ